MRILLLATVLAATLYAENGESKSCSNATIKGSYGYTLSGTRPVPFGPNAGQIEQLIGAGVRHHDGMGNFTQVDTVKGAIAGAVVENATSGTYVVNSDCSGAFVLFIPGPNITVEARFVVVNNGKEVKWIVLTPLSTMVSGHAVRQ